MKGLKKNITVVLIIFISLFTLLVGYFIYDVILYSGRWISSAYNPRLREQRASVIPGSIYDVNGLELAGSAYSKRTYIADEEIRMSVSQIIGDIYGFSPLGVETTQGAWLLGFNEGIADRIKRVLVSEAAHGSDLTLTIDAKLNSDISDMLKNYNGAAVVLNYKTGEILAMVSLPQFDLTQIDVNQIHGGANEESLSNRAVQSAYAPGEVFEVVSVAVAMENLDFSGKSFACKGAYYTEDGLVECDKLHGEQTFEEMIANHCKSGIAQLSVEIGVKNLQRAAEKVGFNYQFLFSDLVLYESEMTLNSLTSDYDLANAGLGIYGVSATPMHMAMIYGAIANAGKIVPLRLLKEIEGVDMSKRNDTIRKSFNYAVAQSLDNILKESNPIIVGNTTICGIYSKVEDESEYYKTVSWYVGYSDNENYPYSIAIAVEDYDKSSMNMKQIAKSIFEKIIENNEGN